MNNNYNKYFTETENGLDIEANNINANCITSQTNKFSLDSEGNLICNSVTTANNNQNSVNFDILYPIGSIYMNVNDVNPSILFQGTTWEKIESKFLLACGNDYKIGATGGESEHTLSLEEMPQHNHMINDRIMVWDSDERGASSNVTYSGLMQYYNYNSLQTTYRGASKAHNNMPPYLAVGVWKRIS